MIVKNQMSEFRARKEGLSEFNPVGMRVLAVDDDQVCLKVLEKMLMECLYHVTTTTQSTKALEMLREDKNKFDLVISDVNMPDMDGFKLLEIVGLEMDLPVIMLSAHKDISWVKKGLLHGACDYLLKPCRMEELQNIWQHVFRRQIDSKELNKASIEEKARDIAREDSQGIGSENNADQNKKQGKRVKEDEEETEEEDDDENQQEDEEYSTRKKPRLLWVNELHKKFVAAVNQLGLERAVPKKILELMNVEGLTRENVASHLQKYRLGLRKAAEQASSIAGLGSSDPYLQMASLDPYSSGSGRFSGTTLPSHVSAGIFSNLNTSPGFNLRGMSSSPLVRHDQSQSMNGPLGSISPSMFSANQSTHLLQGMPSSVEVNPFQQSNYRAGIRHQRPSENSSIFTVPSVYTKSRATFGNGNNYPQSCFTSNHVLLQGNTPPSLNSAPFRNHSPLGAVSVKTGSPDTNICGAFNKSMQNPAQPSKYHTNSLPLSQAFNNCQLPQNSFKFSPSTSHIGNTIPFDSSTTTAIVQESRSGIQCQEGLIGSILQASCYNQNKNQSFNSLVSSNGDTSFLGHNSNQNNTNDIKRFDDTSLANQVNEATPSTNHCPETEKLSSNASMKINDDACNLQRVESQEGINESDFESLDYILGDMVKPEDQQGILFMNEELVFDADAVSCVRLPSEYITKKPEASKS